MKTTLPYFLLLLFLSAHAVSAAEARRGHRIVLPAGKIDRAGQVISVALPSGTPRTAVLRDAAGRVWPLQVDHDGMGRFVVAWQKAGDELAFVLTAEAPAIPARVEVDKRGGDLAISVRGQSALVYRMDRDALPRADISPELKRAGYLHPVLSPKGKVVTDDYPSNHAWHHGIWTPWVETSFQGRKPDFWNMNKKTGAEDFVALERTWNGAVHGGFVARQHMIDLSAPTPVVALHETWEVTAYDLAGAARPVRVFDLVFTQTCATDSPLVLPKYHYGGFAFRGAAEWNGPGSAARFLTSDGITDRIKGNETRGRWCFVGGVLDGEGAGTLILGHPANFRAPQPMRLHPNFPYMSFVPQQLGEFSIEPGKPYVGRFRFVVVDGDPDRELFEAYWNGYADAAVARVVAN
jgi:hypothetical protein